MANILHIGQNLPKLKINLVDGKSFELPQGFEAEYNVCLFYRGHW
jgi:hypothetical protein